METALDALVAKSAAWTVEEMSHQLLYLNTLAYGARHFHDRSALMQVRTYFRGLRSLVLSSF